MHLQAIVCTTLSAHVHCVPSENACNAFTRHPAGAFFQVGLWAGCDATASWYPRLADTACAIGMT